MDKTNADILLSPEGYQFSEETMDGLRELGTVLQSIHNRLLAEGYVLQSGKLVKGDEEEQNNNNNN
jgi:hypothetical protein